MTFYQRKSPRWSEYNYASPGGYFITIVTKNRENYFGNIVDGKMMLNELGKYASEHRNHISDHYTSVEMHDFICMPNHIHGILLLSDTVGTQFFASYENNRTYENTSLRPNCKS
jgi:putative transposase